jgi:hypothetical protein
MNLKAIIERTFPLLLMFSLISNSCQRDKNIALIKERISACCDKKINRHNIIIMAKTGYYTAVTSADDQTRGFYFLGYTLNDNIRVAMIDNKNKWLTIDSINRFIIEGDKKLSNFNLQINDVYIKGDKILIRLITNKTNALFGIASIQTPGQFKNLKDYYIGKQYLHDSVKNSRFN